ncbi:MAG: type II secretion system protein [Oscillospiraceae bacterium]
MRKMLQSKKGFTLVELMIVIVIMGILVAVAIPIYGAVTKNAEKKSCLANQNVIATNLSQFQMSGATGGDMISWDTLASTFKGVAGEGEAVGGFKGLFKDGMPTCPTLDATAGRYLIKVQVLGGIGGFQVRCPGDKAAGCEGHNTVAENAWPVAP